MAVARGQNRFLDEYALAFLGSEFAGSRYVDWPIERRLEAFLRRRGEKRLAGGEKFDELLDRVMTNFARARREGRLKPHHR